MPFIRGRYYVNPIAGQALEAARDFESQLLASRGTTRDGEAEEDNERTHAGGKGPIHRVEVETAELVPSQVGSAEKGYVTRIYRLSPDDSIVSKPSSDRGEAHVFYDKANLLEFLNSEFGKDEKTGHATQD